MGDVAKLSTKSPFLDGIAPPHPHVEGSEATNGDGPAGTHLSKALLDASADCVIAVDRDGRIVEWNPAAEETFGHTRSQALGADLVDLIVPAEERESRRAALIAMVADGSLPDDGGRAERVCVRADGERFPVEITLARVDGPAPIAVGFVRDISESVAQRETSELYLRRREAMTALGHQVLRDAPVDEIGI